MTIPAKERINLYISMSEEMVDSPSVLDDDPEEGGIISFSSWDEVRDALILWIMEDDPELCSDPLIEDWRAFEENIG